jgi:hypothetical protein
MILKPLTAETSLSANSTVGSAKLVRIYNGHTAAVLITNTDQSVSFTMPSGSISFCQKDSTDELSANVGGSAVLVTSVAFNIS